MPDFAKTIGRYLGYGAFFLFALVFFVWLTLPLDAVRDLIIRKASAEHGLDVEIVELDTWGLTGVAAEGVTIRPRPTLEQIAEIEEARQALADWEAAQKAKVEKEGEDAAGKDDDKKNEADNKTALEASTDKVKEAVARKDKRQTPDDPKPVVPTGPLPIDIESLRARVGLWDLLSNDMSGELEATLAGGTVEANFDQSTETVHLEGKWADIDLRLLGPLRSAIPLPVEGSFAGDLELEVPVTDDGKLRLASTLGHLDARMATAAVGPGRIESEKLGAFPYVDIPRVRVDSMDMRIKFEKRRGEFERFDIAGKDIEGQVAGYIQLAPKLELWGPRAHLRFKFSDAFLAKNADVKVIMTSVPYIKRGQSEGYTGFSISGTVAKPRFVPRARNPYKTTQRPAKAAEPSAKKKPSSAKKQKTRRKPAKAKPWKASSTAKSGTKRPAREPLKPATTTAKAEESDEEEGDEVEEDEELEEGDGEDEEEGVEEGEAEAEGEGDSEGSADEPSTEE
jgi:type II secretion system protein N